MIQVTVAEAQKRLPELLALVETGECVVQARPVGQHQPVWRVKPDLEVPVVTTYDVEPVAQHGPGEIRP